MMAHELPMPVGAIHGDNMNISKINNVPAGRTNKKGSNKSKDKKGSERDHKERRLANKKQTDSNTTSSSKLPSASLPDGSKPNFGGAVTTSANSKKKKDALSTEKGSTSSRDKSSSKKKFSDSNNEKKKQHKNKEKNSYQEDTYAGSSFHSSPAALNLPKPSFGSSERTGLALPNNQVAPSVPNGITLYPSPATHLLRQHGNFNGPPVVPLNYMSYNGIPPNVQCQPVYNFSHGSYRQAPIVSVTSSVHQHPSGMSANFVQPNNTYSQQAGQKISFNELLSSTKN